ncbi:MAG TPA: phosphoribulokinase [Anaerolineae bacterium]|nr:phosphoribulokinase [Anaerolineae bacterium]
MRRPIILGIVGDSAAGKTTISKGFANILGADQVTRVCTDDYHKYDRRERAERQISALHHDCNYLDIMQLHLERLHYGQPILKPVYDHSDGTLVRPHYVRPQQFVIVEGLLGFSTEVMRQFYDVKVYLAPDEALRALWKVKRDTTRRGYTAEQVREALRRREPDAERFIRPQRKYADIVVNFNPPPGMSIEEAGPHLNVRLILRPTIPHPDLSYLLEGNNNGSGIRLELGRDHGLPVDILEIDGRVSTDQAQRLANAIWQHMPELRPEDESQFGNYHDGARAYHSHPLALTQLLITYHVLRKYNDLTRMPFAPPVAAMSRQATHTAVVSGQ